MHRKITVEVCDEAGLKISVVRNILHKSVSDRARSIGYLFQSTKERKLSAALSSFKLSKRVASMSLTQIKLLEHGDNPKKGMIYYLLYSLLYSCCFLAAKYLYARDEALGPFQMLFMRSCFAIVFQVIYVNKNLKKAVWDDVDRKSAGPLIFRSIQGSATNIINYSVTKYLPLTIIAIVNNMGPMLTVILAYFILKERLRLFDVVMLVLTIGGVLLVVIYEQPDEESQSTSQLWLYIMYGALFFNPILVSGGSISMRKMKKFHEAVVSFYLNWSILLSSLAVMLIMRSGFNVFANWDWLDWTLSFLTGFFALTSQTCRFMALKYQKASSLQKLQPLTTLFQFLFDILLFHEPFTMMQYIGLGWIFVLYVFQGFKFLIWDLPKERKREEAQKEELGKIDDEIIFALANKAKPDTRN